MPNKLVLTMTTTSGSKSFSYSNAKADPTTAQVKALGQALITNGAYFENVPSAMTAAKIITTTETDYDIS